MLRRVGLASSAFGKLKHRVFMNHRLSLTTKKSIYQAKCFSILLFGCGSSALYWHHFRKLEFFYGNCIQKILGVKWYHKVPRIESRLRIGMSSLEEITLKHQLRWAGHDVRMPADCLPKQIIYGELETCRRSVGGQRKRYNDNLKKYMKSFNIDPNSLELAAADRSKWGQMISTGASLFASAYDAADAARRARCHIPQLMGLTCVPSATGDSHHLAVSEAMRGHTDVYEKLGEESMSSSQPMDFLKQ